MCQEPGLSETWNLNLEPSYGKRLSSAVLNPSSGHNGGLSVDLQQQIEEAGFTLAPYEFKVEPTSETTKQYLQSKKDQGIY